MLTERGWFRSYVLYLDGSPVAFEQGEAVPRPVRLRARGLRPGVRPAPRRRVPAARRRSRISIDDARFSVFDFGLGDAEYKRKLAHRSIEEGDLVGLRAAGKADPDQRRAHRVFTGVSSGVTASLRKVALLDASKQWWRQRARDVTDGHEPQCAELASDDDN